MFSEQNNPLVSVIIPTFNRAHLINNSVNSILNQSYQNIEILIIDDGSTDGTEFIVNKINDNRIKYFRQKENYGASVARNRGIKESKGEFITFLDSDDTFEPTKIERQLSVILKAEKKIGAAYCGINLIDNETGKRIGQKIHRNSFYENFKYGNYLLTPTTGTLLLRKAAIQEVGGFDESLPAHQDTELAIRFCQKYNYILVNEYLVNAVKNHDQISSISINHIRGKEIILEKHEDFLSKNILFNLCKQIANYHLNNSDNLKAKLYIKKAISIKPTKISTVIYLVLLIIYPKLLKKFVKN